MWWKCGGKIYFRGGNITEIHGFYQLKLGTIRKGLPNFPPWNLI